MNYSIPPFHETHTIPSSHSSRRWFSVYIKGKQAELCQMHVKSLGINRNYSAVRNECCIIGESLVSFPRHRLREKLGNKKTNLPVSTLVTLREGRKPSLPLDESAHRCVAAPQGCTLGRLPRSWHIPADKPARVRAQRVLVKGAEIPVSTLFRSRYKSHRQWEPMKLRTE